MAGAYGMTPLNKRVEEFMRERKFVFKQTSFKPASVYGYWENAKGLTVTPQQATFMYRLWLEGKREEQILSVKPSVEAAHTYEQQENGSGIQYFDNLRLGRLTELDELLKEDE
jgi:hypothetical protein